MKTQFQEIWQCSVCRKWFPTAQIRKVPHDTLQKAGSNYLPYSEPSDNAAGWFLADGLWTAPSYEGLLSMGVNGDFRLKVQESTTGTPPLMDTTLLYGAPTFQGPGVLRANEDGNLIYNLMLTGHPICFWLEMGPKEDAPTEITVDVGLLDTVGPGHLHPVSTFTMTGHRRVWFTLPTFPAGLDTNNTYPYVDVTCGATDEWWAQNASLTPGITSPGVFIPNASAARTPAIIATDQWTRMSVYACPADQDEVLLRRRTPGRRENRMIPPYEERET